MNTLTNSLLKRALSILLVTIMVFSLGIVGITSTSAAEIELAETGDRPKVVYFKPNSNWKQGSAWFLAHLWDDDNTGDYAAPTSVKMIDDNGDGIYSVTVPNSAYNRIQFFRKNPSDTTLSTSSKWDQSNAMWLQDNGNDLLTLNDGWSDIDGTWSKHNQVYLSGSFNNWSLDKDIMTASGTTYTKTLSLSANTTYSFKIFEKGTYYSVNATMTSTSCTNYNLYTNSDNLKITTTLAGNYIFSYNATNHTLTVTYPTPAVTLTKGTLTITPSGAVNVGTELTLSTKATLTGGTSSSKITYKLYDGTSLLETKSVAYNTAVSFTTTPSTAGTHTYKITASYSGVSDVSVSKDVTVNDLKDGLTVTPAPGEGFTATEGGLTVNAESDFAINYTASHTDSDVTYQYTFNDPAAERTTATGSTWSYTGTAGETVGDPETVTCYVWAVKNGIASEEYTAVTTTYTVSEFVFTLDVEAPSSVYFNEVFDVTIKTNVDDNDKYTVTYGVYWYNSMTQEYELYSNKGGEEDGIFEGFWFDCTQTGTSTLYYGAVITEVATDEVVKTFADYANQSFDVVIKDYSIDVELTGKSNAGIGEQVTLTANATFNAPESVVNSTELTYSFYSSDDTLLQQGEGNTYTYTTDQHDSDETVSFYVVVSCSVTDNSGYCGEGNNVHNYSERATHSFTVTGDNTEYEIKILFKAPVNWAYKPNMTIKVTDSDSVEKTVTVTTGNDTWIAEFNSSQYYQFYKWYGYELTVVGSDTINLNVAAGRDTFYKGNYEFSVATEADYETSQDGKRLYFFALDNLNNPTDTRFTNISLSEYKDITISATNMITLTASDAASIVAAGCSFKSAEYGDANCDGKINIKDATYVQKSLANIVVADELSTVVSDFNKDGKVTIKDATAIQKQIAGL